MTSSHVLEEVRRVTLENIKILEQKLGRFSGEQRTWKVNENSWNLNEIFAHLNSYASFYHHALKHRISNTKFREFKENFISSPLGKSAWKSMKLGNASNVKRKFKAPRSYNPLVEKTLVTGNDYEVLLKNLHEFLDIIESAKTVNIRKAKVPIAISKIIRLRIGDALLFVAYHNERHIQQALNVASHRAFPQK